MKGIISSVIIMASFAIQDATLASEAMVYSAPEYATVSDPSEVFLVGMSLNPLSLYNTGRESKPIVSPNAASFIYDLRIKLAADAYSEGKMSDMNLVIAMQDYFQQRYTEYTQEKNPLRKRKILRDELIPAAQAKVNEASAIALSTTYFFIDYGNSANSASVQVDPIRLIFDSKHCRHGSTLDDEVIYTNLESYFSFPVPSSHECELSVIIDDEDAAINMVDDIMDSSLVRRTVLKVDPNLAEFDQDYKVNINAKMMGVGLFKFEEEKGKGSAIPIIYHDFSMDSGNAVPQGNSSTEKTPLNIACEPVKFETTGFLTATGFTSKLFVGKANSQVLARIVTYETSQTEAPVEVGRQTPTSVQLLQKTKTSELVANYEVKGNYLYTTVTLPDGVYTTESGLKNGFCKLIENL